MEKYPFDHDFQAEVLHCCLRSGSFIRENREALDADHFGDPVHRGIAEAALRFFDGQGAPPSRGVLQEHIRERYSGAKGITLTAMRRGLREIWDMKGVAVEYIAGAIRKFAAHSEARNLIAEAEDFLLDGKEQEFLSKMDRALSLRHDSTAFTDMGNGMEARFRSYKEGFQKQNPSLTLIPSLDNCFLNQGVGAGELAIILGLTGVGKSHCLVHMGAAAVRQGKQVFHITLEMSIPSVLRRYDQNLTGATDKQIAKKFKKYAKDLGKYPMPKIASFPSRRLTPKGLEALILRERDRHGTPDLVVVDYGMLMDSDHKGMARYEELGEIYAALRDVGDKLGCPVWSAAQVNRSGFEGQRTGGDVITLENISKSFDIGMNIDIAVSLNRTFEEQDNGQARLWVDKNRDAPDNVEIRCEADWTTSTLRQIEY